MNSNKYLEKNKGNAPIILSCPHGGFLKPCSIPNKERGYNYADMNTYFLAKQIIHSLKSHTIDIYYILSKIHRSKIDFNRPSNSSIAYNLLSEKALAIYNDYTYTLLEFSKDCVDLYNKALVIDLHGFTKPDEQYPDIIFGTVFGQSINISPEIRDNQEIFWGVSQLKKEFTKFFTVDDGMGIDTFYEYSGGYITYMFCDIADVNAIQIEICKEIRTDLILMNDVCNAITTAILKCLSIKD